MLQIGICDDLADARFNLRSALEGLLETRGIVSRIFEFSSGVGLIKWLEKHAGELDLVFLDIEMEGLDGMETAQRLRAADAGVQLVFVTSHVDFVFDGYSVGALGYLLKPAKPEQLDDILTRVAAALLLDSSKSFVCRSRETSYRIPRKDVLYFASDRRQITCVTAKREYTFYGKLDEVEAQLQDASFVRIHQRYLVNSAAVEQIEGGEVHVGGSVLPISRSCQQAALLALTDAMLK